MELFKIKGSFGAYGRVGELTTRRGIVKTPTFMPDGTRGVVKSLLPQQVAATGVQVVLANTYHLHLSPGEEIMQKLGGVHVFGGISGEVDGVELPSKYCAAIVLPSLHT
jgi:queuine tRNA-ribosyltransferase